MLRIILIEFPDVDSFTAFIISFYSFHFQML